MPLPTQTIFNVFGETLVLIKGGAHMSGRAIGEATHLGLSTDAIRIEGQLKHTDMHATDFGPDMPMDVMWMLAYINIRMTLIHYDANALDVAMRESMGGGLNPLVDAGYLAPAATLLGNKRDVLTSGNHFMHVTLDNLPQVDDMGPYRFLACYLSSPPLEIPLGTATTAVQLNWRCIPYTTPSPKIIVNNGRYFSVTGGEISSSGVPLWDRERDT